MTLPAAGESPPDPGLAKERTALAWRRTAIALIALDGALVKINPTLGLPALAVSTMIWALAHRVGGHPTLQPGTARPLLTTVGIVAIALVALATVLLGGCSPAHHTAQNATSLTTVALK